MSPVALLAGYCVLILLASLAGGWLPMVARLTHRRMQVALSFVSGVMLGVSFLELLPHALEERAVWLASDAAAPDAQAALPVMLWLLAGFLAMFFLERWFCFHHHEPPADGSGDDGHPSPGHGHELTWTGAAIGLTLHSIIAGAALAASLRSEAGAALAGFGTFLAILLHKPFDALTIGTLMAAGRHPLRVRHLVNALFSLAIPIGAALFLLGLGEGGPAGHRALACALAFSAGTFVCIALSDLLPELQFHQHDRVLLSVALVLGIGLAWSLHLLE